MGVGVGVVSMGREQKPTIFTCAWAWAKRAAAWQAHIPLHNTWVIIVVVATTIASAAAAPPIVVVVFVVILLGGVHIRPPLRKPTAIAHGKAKNLSRPSSPSSPSPAARLPACSTTHASEDLDAFGGPSGDRLLRSGGRPGA